MGARDLLRVRGLSTRFFTEEGQVNAVEDVSFTVREGEVFGIVGESGSGKSVTALSIMDLVESPGRVTEGEIWFRDADLAERIDRPAITDGEFVDVLELEENARRALRGPSFGMIFQDPMSSMDPSVTVGEQIAQAVEAQRRASANPRKVSSRTQGYGLGRFIVDSIVPRMGYVSEDSKTRAIELLEQVGIPDPAERAEEFPHQFSGGMLQRAMIAQALAGEPDLLLADEPTSALDVTIQAQILDLLSDLQDETDMSVVLITHNLGIIARMCERLGVMYAGEIVERGSLADVFESPVHPYTEGLLGSVPDLEDPADRLQPVEGNVPSLLDAEMGDRCYFADRCPKAMEACLEEPPEFAVDGESGADANSGAATAAEGAGPPQGHGAKCVLAERDYDPAEALPDDYFTAQPVDGDHDGASEDAGGGREGQGGGREDEGGGRDGDGGDGREGDDSEVGAR